MVPALYFCDQKLNIELGYIRNDDDFTYVYVRLRPWKNKPFDGNMILAAGEDELVALDAAMHMHQSNMWVPLDWSKRPTIEGTERAIERLRVMRELDSPLPERARKARKSQEDDNQANTPS